MSTDIFMFAEVKTNGCWEAVCDPNDSDNYDDWIFTRGQDYPFFAVLAGVRNYEGYEPISNPKGLPKEASFIIRRESQKDRDIARYHSYYTLSELKNYNWTGLPKIKGYVIKEEYENAMSENGDRLYSTWNEHMLPVLQKQGKEVIEIFENPAEESVKEVIHNLTAIKEHFKVQENQVRIVFWFIG
ncbi:hypothetical protein [Robertmurraya sp. FSL R5-0851]|uniref:hypothetical protein n=1 Tax=Robertmurraya sp. FSL R5-0851 TaxID=2921584 RepID=UPI0030F991AB